MEAQLHGRAFTQMLLHALRHPQSAVCGVLFSPAASDGEIAQSEKLQIEHALPLVHTSVAHAPMLEAALNLAEAHAKSHGLQIAGLYFACEHCDEPGASEGAQLNKLHARIADRVHACSAQAVCLLLENSALSTLDVPNGDCSVADGTSFFRVYRKDKSSGAWPSATSSLSLLDAAAPSHVAQLVRDGQHRRLCDFDDHLDDPASNDWLNQQLFQQVA